MRFFKIEIDSMFPKIFLLLTLILVSNWVFGQTTNPESNDEEEMLWATSSGWTNLPTDETNFLDGILDEQLNITVNGDVTRDGNINVSGDVEINITSGDTLLILGNLIVESTGSLSLHVHSGAFFILRGDFNNQSSSSLAFDANNGFLGVKGDYSESVEATGGIGNSVYVIGEKTGTYLSSTGGIDELVENEDASTRKLLLGEEELSWTINITEPLCFKSGNGEVNLQGQGGSYAYQYSIDGSSWEPSSYTNSDYTFSNMPAGDTAIWVRDDDSPQNVSGRVTITIDQPDSLELSIDAQTWSCDGSTNGCNAYITASITGGTPPYDVVLDDGTTSVTQSTNNNYTFNGLCAGTYTIDVTDANGCNLAEMGNVTITEDATPPSCTEFPGDSTFTLDQFNELDSIYAYLTRTGPSYEQNNLADEDTIIYTFDGNNFNDLFLNFAITQDGDDDWDTSDSVAFWLDYNNDYNTDVRLYADSSGHVAPSDSVALPDIASGKSSINILIIYTTGGDKSYIFDEVTLSGNSMAASIPTSISGEPTGCTDDFVTPDITYSDDFIQWVCNESGNKEFWFERTFTISDGCDNEETYTHKIGVGDYPWIEEPKDTILDNCNVTNIQLPVPGYGDACDTDASLNYVVKAQGETSNVAAGSVNSGDAYIEVTFTQPEVNDTIYEVTWTATDIAGLITNEIQEVKVLRPMTVALNPVKEDFCSGELVSFEIVVDGGTGAYKDPVITPSGGTLTKDSDDTYTYETDQLDLDGTTDLTINITSEDNVIESVNVEGGSCSTGDLVFYHGTGVEDSYTIHENISTNPVERP